MDPKLRVVIVDGSAQIRAAIAALLDGERDVAVVGQAGSLRECAAADAADVVVADLRACLTDPGTLRSLRARHPALRLIITIPNSDHEYSDATLEFAPYRCVPKTHLAAELPVELRGILSVA